MILISVRDTVPVLYGTSSTVLQATVNSTIHSTALLPEGSDTQEYSILHGEFLILCIAISVLLYIVLDVHDVVRSRQHRVGATGRALMDG